VKALTIYRRLIADGHRVSLKNNLVTVELFKPMPDFTQRRIEAHAADLVALLTIKPGRWRGEDSIHKLFTQAVRMPKT
jgi:hypothetical protein